MREVYVHPVHAIDFTVSSSVCILPLARSSSCIKAVCLPCLWASSMKKETQKNNNDDALLLLLLLSLR